jgi:deazaflavin-dependent oxidoreductase (nitroreductase family)
MSEVNDWNKTLIAEFRAKGGQVAGQFAGRDLLLLTTTGAKSGQKRTNPVAFTRDGDRFLIIASEGGGPTNPDWFHNLVAHPEVTIEVGNEKLHARATVPAEPERTRLYNQMATALPGFAEYQRNTTRQIPLVILQPGK